VLQHEPRGIRRFASDDAAARPTELAHDRRETRRVPVVHLGHARLIAVEQDALGQQFGANAPILFRHGDQLGGEPLQRRGVHVGRHHSNVSRLQGVLTIALTARYGCAPRGDADGHHPRSSARQ
jgi:hypothetical protein